METKSIHAYFKHCSRLMIHSVAADKLCNEARSFYMFAVGDGGPATLAKAAYEAARLVADEARKTYFAERRKAENELEYEDQVDRLHSMLDAMLLSYNKSMEQRRADEAQAPAGQQG